MIPSVGIFYAKWAAHVGESIKPTVDVSNGDLTPLHKAPIMEVDKDGTKRNIGGGKGNRKGTPQGGVISPLLSNRYLHILDRIWEREIRAGDDGAATDTGAATTDPERGKDESCQCLQGEVRLPRIYDLDGEKQEKWENVSPRSTIEEIAENCQRSSDCAYKKSKDGKAVRISGEGSQRHRERLGRLLSL